MKIGLLFFSRQTFASLKRDISYYSLSDP